ncbi:hypothetical protein [Halobacillus litoralis]|uniref:hypothetical protein n=1 Tax=Halobacillus litoralis TaxID=45668 RepID=UPI001CFD5DF3|nr:hypothetical protein [Halobacillus litoralis]
MDRKKMVMNLFLILGVISGGSGFLYRMLITSDIPVTYSISEALAVHVLFALSAVCFLIGSSLLQTLKENAVAGMCFAFILIVNLLFLSVHIGAEYFNSSFAQLELSSLLYSSVVLLYNGYLIINQVVRTRQRSSYTMNGSFIREDR